MMKIVKREISKRLKKTVFAEIINFYFNFSVFQNDYFRFLF